MATREATEGEEGSNGGGHQPIYFRTGDLATMRHEVCDTATARVGGEKMAE